MKTYELAMKRTALAHDLLPALLGFLQCPSCGFAGEQRLSCQCGYEVTVTTRDWMAAQDLAREEVERGQADPS